MRCNFREDCGGMLGRVHLPFCLFTLTERHSFLRNMDRWKQDATPLLAETGGGSPVDGNRTRLPWWLRLEATPLLTDTGRGSPDDGSRTRLPCWLRPEATPLLTETESHSPCWRRQNATTLLTETECDYPVYRDRTPLLCSRRQAEAITWANNKFWE
jgi:hypothetical protein